MSQKNIFCNVKSDAFHPSPFHLETDWIIKTENKNKTCTHTEIDTLNAKGIINYIDFKIMELLATYKVINTYNINYALTYLLPACYQRDNYGRNLSKLVKAGIILKYALYSRKEDGTDGSVQSPLRFYSLSVGGYSYIAPIVTNPHKLTSAYRDYKIMEQLALSQLLLHFSNCYNTSILHVTQNITKTIGSSKISIDCFLRYKNRSQFPFPVSIFLFCCRDHPDSHKDCLTRISLFLRWLPMHLNEYPNYLITIAVENVQEIFLLHHSIMARDTPFRPTLYYTLDSEQLCNPFFDNLYQCSYDEEDSHLQLTHIRLFS